MRLVFLDTETTGFNRRRDGRGVCYGHRIVEIGCIEVIDGREFRRFHVYLNPDQKIDPKATAVNGITDEFLIGKPSFGDVASEFVDFISDALVVIHNAPFDIAFIDQEFGLLNRSQQPIGKKFRVEDTLTMARRLFPRERNDLDSLSSRLEITGRGKFHGAIEDAEILKQVYFSLHVLP